MLRNLYYASAIHKAWAAYKTIHPASHIRRSQSESDNSNGLPLPSSRPPSWGPLCSDNRRQLDPWNGDADQPGEQLLVAQQDFLYFKIQRTVDYSLEM